VQGGLRSACTHIARRRGVAPSLLARRVEPSGLQREPQETDMSQIDRGTLIQNTRNAGQAVLKDGNISQAQFAQMTDGTVSRTDIKNAENAYQKAREQLETAALGGDKKEIKEARAELANAKKLVEAVKQQHANQSWIETGWENSKDAVIGS
jgi:hypothetical protein